MPLPTYWNIEVATPTLQHALLHYVQHDLANCLVSLGCSHDALLIYERLKLWEGLISCLKNIGRVGKVTMVTGINSLIILNQAEQVIREQLKIKETPSLWCHLGDITEVIRLNSKSYGRFFPISIS